MDYEISHTDYNLMLRLMKCLKETVDLAKTINENYFCFMDPIATNSLVLSYLLYANFISNIQLILWVLKAKHPENLLLQAGSEQFFTYPPYTGEIF